ncbi:ferritin family protein [Geoalkalibacter halelectricus]|uniref:Ferritin family protein n=1 Tax=Geoalkalibacter halelectricus TaxID=2847045 RepID=A0ABY5ZI60_9BACT|nr:ferritin family protein [Geoalkalibacter halelectricus]MDO3378997.1 ferritin family protein [Geoalkalibacter halelectricus]UWZ78811.1 ferritin family protein [Geoalkalibacter halelectricus]
MPQEYKMKEALKMAISAKKNLMDFYRQAAAITENENGKKVFTRLADEVQENARKFYSHYKWEDIDSFETLMEAAPQSNSVMLAELKKALDKNLHERKARELALKEQEDMEKTFRLAASHIIDPQVRAVFEEVARDARTHYEIIESEYARTMAMVHETDIDTYVRE